MKSVQYDRYGGPEVMSLADHALPPLRDDEVRIETKAAAINPFDWKLRRGAMRLVTGWRFPRAMGTDFAGIVEVVGRGVKDVQVGEEVFGTVDFKKSGAFAERIVVNVASVAKKPTRLSFAEASCLPVAAATAWVAILEKAKAQANSRIFIHGCGGAVGAFAAQLAIAQGANVAGSCGPGSVEAARRSGVDPILSYADVQAYARAGMFDAVFDTLGTLDVGAGLGMLKPGGVFIEINTTPLRFMRGAVSRRYRLVFATMGLKHLQLISELAEVGTLRPTVGRETPFSEAIQSITDAEIGPRRSGKSVIVF